MLGKVGKLRKLRKLRKVGEEINKQTNNTGAACFEVIKLFFNVMDVSVVVRFQMYKYVRICV